MPSASDIKPAQGLVILVIGKSKLGKTEGAATFPRPLFLDFDAGVSTVTNPGFAARHPQVKLGEILYDTFIDDKVSANGIIQQAQAYDRAMQFINIAMSPTPVQWQCQDGTMMEVGRDKFDTFVVDSITMLGQVAMNKAISLMGDSTFASGRDKTDTLEKARRSGMISPKGADYASSQNLILALIDRIRMTGKNVIFIAHEATISNSSGSVMGYEIMTTGKAVEQIPLRFSEVYFLLSKPAFNTDGSPRIDPVTQRVVTQRVVQTSLTTERKACSRLGVPDDTPWEYNAIISAINGNRPS